MKIDEKKKKTALIACAEILEEAKIISRAKKKKLVKGVEEGDENSYKEITDCLMKFQRIVKK